MNPVLRARIVVVALLLGSTLPVGAQVVRGTARERASGTPIPGVLVTLDRAADAGAVARSVLTNARGEYTLRGPTAGEYRVSAKRIGVQRYQSEVFSLGAGESRVINLALDAVVHTLDQVVVEREALCVLHSAESQHVAAMWDEIQTALTAATISVRDSLFRGRVSRYARLLDPGTLRVLREAREEAEGTMVRPFESPAGDSLSDFGYWRRMPGDTLAFFGPDAEVLLTEAFRRDHCFSVSDRRHDRVGMVGLAFEPTRSRTTAEIEGVIWLDERSLELRLAEFRYTGLARIQHVERIGGEVYFTRLPNGAWIVDRWYIRMPRFGIAPWREGSRISAYSAQGFQLPRIDQILEEGGEASAVALRDAALSAVAGLALDSLGRPFHGAQVRVAGTDVEASVDSNGTFSLRGLSAGRYLVELRHSDYAPYGVPAAETEVVLESGGTPALALRALNMEGLAARMCAGRDLGAGRVAIRITLVDSVSGVPIMEQALRMRWSEYESRIASGLALRRVQSAQLNGTTDPQGSVVFCGVPAGVTAELGFAFGEQDMRIAAVLRVPEVAAWAHLVASSSRRGD